MLTGVPKQSLEETFLRYSSRHRLLTLIGTDFEEGVFFEKIRGHSTLGRALARARFGAGVHLDDGGPGNSAFELQKGGRRFRGPLGQLRPIQQYRMVARKVAQIVLQDSQ